MNFESDEWGQWDGSTPFWHHYVAGSLAGVAEHGLVYPLDTVRTHMQVCTSCPSNKIANRAVSLPPTGLRLSSTLPRKSPLLSSSSSWASFKMQRSSWGSISSTPKFVSRISATASSTISTLKTPPGGMWDTILYLIKEPGPSWSFYLQADSGTTGKLATRLKGITRLFRGMQSNLIGVIPADGAYFASYETVKSLFIANDKTYYSNSYNSDNHLSSNTNYNQQHLEWYGSAVAGACAALSHEIIMTPLDTVKQRMQLGHYNSCSEALRSMIRHEGFISLYRSLSVTLITNVPYAMITVLVNESLKEKLTSWSRSSNNNLDIGNMNDTNNHLSLCTTLFASSIAGLVASASTTPLDRIKTILQTQTVTPACLPTNLNQSTVSSMERDIASILRDLKYRKDCPMEQIHTNTVVVKTWRDALKKILREEGTIGLFRGTIPRVLSCTPMVAISWTTYETIKQMLSTHCA